MMLQFLKAVRETAASASGFASSLAAGPQAIDPETKNAASHETERTAGHEPKKPGRLTIPAPEAGSSSVSQARPISKSLRRAAKRANIQPELLLLRAEIERTRWAIDTARNHFEQVVDPTLIDCYIYELNAAQLRYQFLLRKFKSQET